LKKGGEERPLHRTARRKQMRKIRKKVGSGHRGDTKQKEGEVLPKEPNADIAGGKKRRSQGRKDKENVYNR